MKQPLKDIADIQMGYQDRKRKTDPTPDSPLFRIVQIKDLDPDGNLIPDGLDSIQLDSDPGRYQVQPADVLFVSRGLRLQAAPVIEPLPNTIASSYLFVLRLRRKDVAPEFLAWCLNHTPGRKFLAGGARQRTNMPYVSRQQLEAFEVPIPPLETQRRILELDRLLQEERRLMCRLEELRSVQIEQASLSLIAGQLRIKESL